MRGPVLALLGVLLVGMGASACGGSSCDPVYIPPPRFPELSAVTPDEGLIYGGEIVTLTGDYFATRWPGETVVRFGGVDAANVIVVDDQTLTCVVPPNPQGPVRVEVRNDNGWAELENGYLYRPPPVTFEVEEGATAEWSDAVEQTPGVMTLCFETPTDAARGKALLPYDGTLGEILTFHYDTYSSADNYAPFVRIELEASPAMAPATKVVLIGEPVYTTGWGNLPSGMWHSFDCLEMTFAAFEIDDSQDPPVIVNWVDCPWDQPTLHEYVNGDATTLGNFCAIPAPWATAAYGPLTVLEIAIQAGYGGPWVGFVGYADDVTINDRTFAATD